MNDNLPAGGLFVRYEYGLSDSAIRDIPGDSFIDVAPAVGKKIVFLFCIVQCVAIAKTVGNHVIGFRVARGVKMNPPAWIVKPIHLIGCCL